MISVNVETRRATVTERELLTSGSVGIQAQFTFSEEWDGLARVAVFRYSEEGTPYSIILDSTNIAEVPAICFAESGEPLFIGAYGADGNGNIVIPTIWVSAGVVREGVEPLDAGTMPDDPDTYWVQVLGLANTANDTANAANDTAADALATATNAMTQVTNVMQQSESARQAAQAAADTAIDARDNAIDASITAQSWAVGNTGTREGEDTNNAMYWAGQAEATVEAAVGDIEEARDDAISDVQAEGTTQIGLVQDEGTTQIGLVNAAGSTQITAVQGEGSTQIAAVQAEGAAQQALLQPYVTAASGYADAASTSASSASGSATSASASATSAGASKTAAEAAQTAAEAAQTAAETAQGKAEDAQDAAEDAQAAAEAAAESVSESAAQIATNTANIAQNTSDIADNTADITLLNQQIDSKAPVIIDTASGAIASFSDGADGMPVKSLVCQINSVQSGTGDPSPTNVRPISGWTGLNLTRDGKNLLPNIKYQPSANFAVLGQNKGFRQPSTFLKAGTYRFTVDYPSTVSIYIYSASGIDTRLGDTPTATFTLADDDYVSLYIYSGSGINIDSISSFQLEVGTTASAYEEFNGETIPISWQTEAGTVYGGNIELATGKLVANVGMYEIPSNQTWYVNASLGVYCVVPSITNHPTNIPSGYGAVDGVKCSRYNPQKYAPANMPEGGVGVCSTGISGSFNIYLRDSNITTVAEAQAQLAGMQIVYPLATPITVQLDPVTVSTLLGQNNIFADNGDVECEYPCDTKLYIDKKLAALVAALS